VSFGGVALGIMLGLLPTYAALPVAILGALLIMKLTEHTRVYGDAAIGIVSAVGLAGGVILASLGGGFDINIMSFLFGNILAITQAELTLAVIISILVILLIAVFGKDLFAITFDSTYARTLGVKTKRVDALFFVITAVVVVLAIQLVGVLLVSALLILPAVTALQLAKSFKGALTLSATFAIMSVIMGVFVSFLLDIPTGATIVLVSFIAFVIAASTKSLLKQS
jgi:zinc transport system permease protein